MNADEALRPVGGSGQPRDRNRRGVGGDDGFWFEPRAQVREDLALDLFLFDRGLDHDVTGRQRVVFFRRLDQRQRVLSLILADGVLGNLARHVAVDGRHAGLDALARHVVQHDWKARQRANMGNAVAHLSGADYPDTFNIERHNPFPSMRRPSVPAVSQVATCALLRRTARQHHARAGSFADVVNAQACQVPPPVPAAPDKDRRPARSRRPGKWGPPRPC